MLRLTNKIFFPLPDFADDEGLLAVGGDLSPSRLLCAYRMGIFPWYEEGYPILWWSPDPRAVLFPQDFHLSKRSARRIRKAGFEIRADTAFEQVIRRCATIRGPRREGTWITSEMLQAYCRLHELGYAHSFETWLEGRLVGGLYGVSLGACFFGESMFSEVSEASRAALARLVDCAKSWQFLFIDCQLRNDHLMRLGAREISRRSFLKLLEEALRVHPTRQGRWTEAVAAVSDE
ncbi:MAG TPA: leucyl/phenylalanyl-tRNA--protein transferase [Candidatus Hydrogenedentes bacterium]|nr:leucyl/phenylalanyl-tRNA--protein transferase [Candidatus Hydrogenedentota bacterium]HOL75940.1 leucyl/phenylalanyl-tRNA--protein transferase [Candidatus Hydrogenedentota bacterium]HPO85651.1 leucyl/phenylalanyl-tRNA--protein transferase [Candidatus Hydrogenedentota bacterium]